MWVCLLTLPRASWYAGHSFPPSCLDSRQLPARGRGSRQGPPELACSSIPLRHQSSTPAANLIQIQRVGPRESRRPMSTWPGCHAATWLVEIAGVDKGQSCLGTDALRLGNWCASSAPHHPAARSVCASCWGVDSTPEPMGTCLRGPAAHTPGPPLCEHLVRAGRGGCSRCTHYAHEVRADSWLGRCLCDTVPAATRPGPSVWN